MRGRQSRGVSVCGFQFLQHRAESVEGVRAEP